WLPGTPRCAKRWKTCCTRPGKPKAPPRDPEIFLTPRAGNGGSSGAMTAAPGTSVPMGAASSSRMRHNPPCPRGNKQRDCAFHQYPASTMRQLRRKNDEKGERHMATDYDAPRKSEEDLSEDSIEELKARRSEQGSSSAVEEDEAEAAEGFELPGADLSGEE